MPLPKLTPEEQQAALAKAAAARTARAELRKKVKNGQIKVTQVLQMTEDPVAAKIKVSSLLESLPGYGKAKVAKLMEELNIDPSRRVKGLGEVQRKAIIDYFSE
ncbi:MAG: integration host factor [Coriobacteriia bacterium]|nr:integration host factor [Coriobacteriia bacterium]